MEKIEIKRHETIDDCLAAHFHCSVDELDQIDGEWRWAEADGEHHVQGVQESLVDIRKRDCWGWVENKHRIHVWYAKNVDIRNLFALFAHEIGHLERPYHNDNYVEEQKARKYERVALTTLDIMYDLFYGQQ
jgi:hypothetical protein